MDNDDDYSVESSSFTRNKGKPANADSTVEGGRGFADGEPGKTEKVGTGPAFRHLSEEDRKEKPEIKEPKEQKIPKDHKVYDPNEPVVTTTVPEETQSEEGKEEVEAPEEESGKGAEKPSETKKDPKQDQSTAEQTQSAQAQDKRPSVTSQRILDAGMAGLGVAGNLIGGANKAFSALRGLAGALTSRQLMSDPTVPVRGFLDSMDQAGQVFGDAITAVGEAYGIKDGVRREDLVGTYRGGRYYKERKQIEDNERQFYQGVGTALGNVLGENVDVNDPVQVQSALSRMDASQLSRLNDALFGQNGTLTQNYNELMGRSDPSKADIALANLYTDLNKVMRQSAQNVAREASRGRSDAITQAQEQRAQLRQLRVDDRTTGREASGMVAEPDRMAGMDRDAQMAVILRSALGSRYLNRDLPVEDDGQGNSYVDIDNLDARALLALRRDLEGRDILSNPNTRDAAQEVYNNVTRRLDEIASQRAASHQAYRNSQLEPIMNSPQDMDLAQRNIRRDRYGIPSSSQGRGELYNNAYSTMEYLRNNNGSQEDIALCLNVMTACEMADTRDRIFNGIRRQTEAGNMTPLEGDMLRHDADAQYNNLMAELAIGKDDRDDRMAMGQSWSVSPYTNDIVTSMRGIEDNVADYANRPRRERLAQEEADALYDDRGVSRASDNRYRERDRRTMQDELRRIEIMMNDPDIDPTRSMALGLERSQREAAIRQSMQEDHIQSLIRSAGGVDPQQLEAAVNGLRDQYADWGEFGRALNEVRANLGLPSDRAWASSASNERERRAQARADAITQSMGRVENTLNQMLAGQGDVIQQIRDSAGTVANAVRRFTNQQTKDLGFQMDNQRRMFQDWFMSQWNNQMRDEIQSIANQMAQNTTDRLQELGGTISSSIDRLGEDLRAEFTPYADEIKGNTARIARQLKGYYMASGEDRNNALGQVLDAVKAQTDAIDGLSQKVSEHDNLGGVFVGEDIGQIRSVLDQLRDLYGEQEAFVNRLREESLEGRDTRLEDLVDRWNDPELQNELREKVSSTFDEYTYIEPELGKRLNESVRFYPGDMDNYPALREFIDAHPEHRSDPAEYDEYGDREHQSLGGILDKAREHRIDDPTMYRMFDRLLSQNTREGLEDLRQELLAGTFADDQKTIINNAVEAVKRIKSDELMESDRKQVESRRNGERPKEPEVVDNTPEVGKPASRYGESEDDQF